MGNQLTDAEISEIKEICTKAVAILVAKGHKAKVGTRSGIAYPLIKKGEWNAALLLDTGRGWTCPYTQVIRQPHWDWFLTPNMDMVNVSLMSGIAYGLIFDIKSPQLIARTLEYLVSDPCRIPNGNCTENFKCMRCETNWDTKFQEKGVTGRAFEHLWTISPVENTKVPADWDADEVIELFGAANFEKDER